MTSRNDRSPRIAVSRWVAAAVACGSLTLHAAELPISTDTPEATVRSLHEGLVAVATEEGDAPLEERYRALEPLIEATHDLPYIAQFAIRRQWSDLAAEEQARFVEAFTRLSVTTYAARFGGVSEASFEMGETATLDSGRRAEVSTSISRADGSSVPLEYMLQQGEDGWKIINIIADGVSDLALKRAEYQRVLSSGSIEDLIVHVEEQAAQLRE